MSRIGLKPVTVPAGVEVKVDEKNIVTVKGPKGQLTQAIDPSMKIEINDGILTVQDQLKIKNINPCMDLAEL